MGRTCWVLPIVCVFLSAIIWAVFGQTCRHEFVNYDDGDYVTDNPQVSRGLTFRGIVWAFTRIHSANWHPLTWISHMADCQIYGLNPGGHHLTNVLLHSLMAILLFLVLRQMTGALWRSAFVATVFAIHPLRVESVAWVSERKDILSGIFFVLTVWAYAKYVSGLQVQISKRVAACEDRVLAVKRDEGALRKPRLSKQWYLWTLLFFACGLMCKPMLVTLPFVLLLLDYWPLQRFDLCDVRLKLRPFHFLLWPQLREKIPFLLLSTSSSVVTLFAQQKAMTVLPLSLRINNALISYVNYARQMFWPSDLALSYPMPVRGIPTPDVALSVFLLVIVSAAVFVGRRHRFLLTGWLWYLLMLAPVIGILQVGTQARADRYTYLPQIGLYLVIVWGLVELCAARRLFRPILAGIAVILVGALMIRARIQVTYWRNSESLWTRALECNPANFVAQNNLGSALLQQGKIDEAIAHLRLGVQIKPGFSKALNNLGYALIKKGNADDAIVYLERALKADPDDVEAQHNLGRAFLEKGLPDRAIVHFQKALNLDSHYADVHNHLGTAYVQCGKTAEAIRQFQEALILDPEYVEARNNLGCALTLEGKLDQAIMQLQKALATDPSNVGAHNNLGNALFQKGKINEAVTEFQKTIQIKPDHAEAHYNLGNAFSRIGKLDAAIFNFSEALRINHNDPEAHNNLANALSQEGKEAEAIDHYRKALEIRPEYPEAQNGLAWILATSRQSSLRDSGKALALAQEANRLIGGEHPIIYRTLAAAYAEGGQFDDAKRCVRIALQLAQNAGQYDLLKPLQDDLRRYINAEPLY
jgi:tetratricopeptide (TPR) repeat protein